MKKSEEMRLKQAIYESTLSTAGAVPLPQWGRLRYESIAFSHCQNKYTHMWENNTDGQSLPRVGKVASGASRIGF